MSKKDQMMNLLHKEFKTEILKMSVLKMLKQLKEDVDKVTKMIYEQNGNFGKEIENLKRN